MLYATSVSTGNKKTLAAERSTPNNELNNDSEKQTSEQIVSADLSHKKASAMEKKNANENTSTAIQSAKTKSAKNSDKTQSASGKNGRSKHYRERISGPSKTKIKKQPIAKTSKSKQKGGKRLVVETKTPDATTTFAGTTSDDASTKNYKGKSVLQEIQSPLVVKLNERAKKTEAEKNDAVNEIAAVDSTNEQTEKPKKEPNTEKNWMGSLYAGPQWGINSIPKDPAYDFTEKTSFYFSAEINRNLFAGFGATTGVGYTSRSETVTYNQFTYDSLYLGIDSIPVYGEPNFPDSITGYTYFNNYQIDTTKTQQVQTNGIHTVAIPLYISRHFAFSDKWGMLVNAGAIFRFNSFSTGNQGPVPVTNAFTISPTLRVHMTYTQNNWMFSLGVNGGIDLKQALIYEGIDRKRSYLTPQFAVHFRF